MFGAQTPAHMVQLIADEKERAYREIVRRAVPLAPGLFPLLQNLSSAGARLALGSSALQENIDLILDEGGLPVPGFRRGSPKSARAPHSFRWRQKLWNGWPLGRLSLFVRQSQDSTPIPKPI